MPSLVEGEDLLVEVDRLATSGALGGTSSNLRGLGCVRHGM